MKNNFVMFRKTLTMHFLDFMRIKVGGSEHAWHCSPDMQ